MVEINNQRKAFLDMLARSEELITDVRKPEIMVMTSLQAESYLLITQITLATAPLNQNPKTEQAPDATSFFLLVGCLPQAAWPERLLSEKSDAYCSRLRSVASVSD